MRLATAGLALGAILLGVSCGGGPAGPSYPLGPSQDDRAATIREFQAAKVSWAARGLRDYRFRFARLCFCSIEYRAPARITVVDGRIVQVVRLDTGPVPAAGWEPYRTIDGLFGEIEAALRAGAWEVRAVYDPLRGHPAELYIDTQRDAVDEEVWYYVSELGPPET